MAVYKVPQDVEAEDKLLGPFTFRQFIYLGIVAAAIGIAILFFKILPFLVVIPLPIILFFGALALPLRKDQPMELYLAAILSFYLRPRKHLWQPDGIESLVLITAPKDTEAQLTKNVSGEEAERRLRYLSELSDSRGWSIRGVKNSGSPMLEDTYNEAQQTIDVLDEDSSVYQSFNQKISDHAAERHKQMLAQFQSAAAASATNQSSPQPEQTSPQEQETAPSAVSQPNNPFLHTETTMTDNKTAQYTEPAPVFNPYPNSMNQSIIQPLSDSQPEPSPQPPVDIPNNNDSPEEVSPDIIKLADNQDWSVETIAREAKRLKEKKISENEVYITLR